MRVRVDIVGVVQGVGFRPAVARVAARHGVAGLVFNDSGSVHCEFEGPPGAVDAAVAAVSTDAPPMARIDDVDFTIGSDQEARDLIDRLLCRRQSDPLRRAG